MYLRHTCVIISLTICCSTLLNAVPIRQKRQSGNLNSAGGACETGINCPGDIQGLGSPPAGESGTTFNPFYQTISAEGGQLGIPGVTSLSEKMARMRLAVRQSLGLPANTTEDPTLTNLLFDGDTILPDQVIEDITLQANGTEGRRKKRRATGYSQLYYWPDVRSVGYIIDPVSFYNDDEKKAILGGIQMFHEYTCIRFKEIPFTDVTTHRINFSRRQGCWSAIGYRGDTVAQTVSIGNGCTEAAIVAHELGHALGLYHEQARPDRPQHLRVALDNVETNFRDQFVSINHINDYGVPYDFGSLMHYSGKAFAKDLTKNTMVTLDPLRQQTLGQIDRFSWSDKVLFNRAFCADACKPEQLKYPCMNSGFQHPNNCTKCMCPDGWTGTYCQNLELGVKSSCGGYEQFIGPSTAILVESPNYYLGSNYIPGTRCTWVFATLPGYRLVLEFVNDDFNIHCSWWARECISDWVEVRPEEGYFNATGPRFCCRGTPDAKITSKGRKVMILFRTSDKVKNQNYKGFQAKVFSQIDPDYVPGTTQRPTSPTTSPTTRRTSATTRRTSVTTRPTSPTTRRTSPTTRRASATTRRTTSTTTTSSSGCGACSMQTGQTQASCVDSVTRTCRQKQTINGETRTVTFACTETERYCCDNAVLKSSDNMCEVPTWGQWGSWSSCTASCGGCGLRTRRRLGFLRSTGATQYQASSESCNTQACSFNSCRPAFCNLSTFVNVPICTKSCPSCCYAFRRVGNTCVAL